jgi:hypothetical protein
MSSTSPGTGIVRFHCVTTFSMSSPERRPERRRDEGLTVLAVFTAASNDDVVNVNKGCRPVAENGEAGGGLSCFTTFQHHGLPMQMATLQVEGISAAGTAIARLCPQIGSAHYLAGIDHDGHGDDGDWCSISVGRWR